MSKNPRPRRATPPRATNDNTIGVKPPPRYVWSVYRAASRARWVGRVIASTADEPIAAAAVQFGTDAWKLIAVLRHVVV